MRCSEQCAASTVLAYLHCSATKDALVCAQGGEEGGQIRDPDESRKGYGSQVTVKRGMFVGDKRAPTSSMPLDCLVHNIPALAPCSDLWLPRSSVTVPRASSGSVWRNKLSHLVPEVPFNCATEDCQCTRRSCVLDPAATNRRCGWRLTSQRCCL